MLVARWSKRQQVLGWQQVSELGTTKTGGLPPTSLCQESNDPPDTPAASTFQSPSAIAHESVALPQTLWTMDFPLWIGEWPGWTAITQSSLQLDTGQGGFTSITANPRCPSQQMLPPPSFKTCQPGATMMDTASSYSLEAVQLGTAAPCSSKAAAICAPDSSTNCWNFACAARVQEASASAHCQWGSHFKVVIFTAAVAAAGGWIVPLMPLESLVSDLDGIGELLGWDAACDVFGPCVVDSGAGGPNEVDVPDVTSCSMP
mmetsp:Transcript_80581/g.133332  ORF Transcript_80581/g.133332 Transcript_80581/m.133332 type:complete len:260 (-) Transcript_80581:109-888(-)